MDVRLAEEVDEQEDEAPSEEQDEAPAEPEKEPANEFNAGELFCRFAPWQIDRMASALLGERPLCERWISRDGRLAILRPLRLTYTAKRKSSKIERSVTNLVELWKMNIQRKA